ncbi:MAG TPA: rRNA maturation RNase YbeY [Thiobacillaceae bacterium]|nr:rRNA maturation RNase YbeY [Thiobacillaceae bacterium]HNU63739.1 rRNA maturation RNase YbeY [Thiobacillaceae bacterium]
MPTRPAPRKPLLELSIQFALKADGLPTRADFRRWARAALTRDVLATLRVVDAGEGRELNRNYRGKDYPTNVLTFDYGPDPETAILTGDIVLCAPVVRSEAAQQGKSLAAHFAHLTVHGMLHLQGHDHETGDADAIAMEAVESFIMQTLGFTDPHQ